MVIGREHELGTGSVPFLARFVSIISSLAGFDKAVKYVILFKYVFFTDFAYLAYQICQSQNKRFGSLQVEV